MKILSTFVGLVAATMLLSVGAAFAALPDAAVAIERPAPVIDCPVANQAPAVLFFEVTKPADCDPAYLAETEMCFAPAERPRVVLATTMHHAEAQRSRCPAISRAPPG